MSPELRERAVLMAELLMQASHISEPGSPERGSFAWNEVRTKTAETLAWIWQNEPSRFPLAKEGPLFVEIGPAARQAFRQLLRRAHREVASEVVQAASEHANR